MSTISKRELLSFCQLANLDWQFVDLKLIKDEKNTTILSKVLNPNYFLRTTKDIYGEIIKTKEGRKWEDLAIYGEDEEGRIALKKKIGMTMELLEKKESGSKEGSYLDEWEVLGGYDNYLIEQEEMEKEFKANQILVEEEKNRLRKKVKKILEKSYQKVSVPKTALTVVAFGALATLKPRTEKTVIFNAKEKEMIMRGQCTEKLREERCRSSSLTIASSEITREDKEDLDSWLSLHTPEREIIERETADGISRERRDVIISEVMEIGTIVALTGVSINSNLKGAGSL